MVADGEGGGRAVKVDYSTFLRIFFLILSVGIIKPIFCQRFYICRISIFKKRVSPCGIRVVGKSS